MYLIAVTSIVDPTVRLAWALAITAAVAVCSPRYILRVTYNLEGENKSNHNTACNYSFLYEYSVRRVGSSCLNK